jgi:hypothetical protein
MTSAPKPAEPGSGLKEDAEPFAAHLRLKIRKARDVAARSCQARDEAAIDRIGDLREDDWDRLGEPLKLCQCRIAGDYDCVRCCLHQLGRRGLPAIGTAIAPAIVKPNIAIIGPAEPLETFAKSIDACLTRAIDLRIGGQ